MAAAGWPRFRRARASARAGATSAGGDALSAATSASARLVIHRPPYRSSTPHPFPLHVGGGECCCTIGSALSLLHLHRRARSLLQGHDPVGREVAPFLLEAVRPADGEPVDAG